MIGKILSEALLIKISLSLSKRDFENYNIKLRTELVPIQEQLSEVQIQLDVGVGSLRTNAQINSSYSRLAE